MTGSYKDRYCDPETGTFINSLGIKDPALLKEFEDWSVKSRTGEAFNFANTCKVPDAECLKGVHRILFQDVYGWAGEFRTIPIAKGKTEFLREGLEKASNVAGERFVGRIADKPEQLSTILAGYWAEVNYIHPFVEGNGRTTQLVVSSLARKQGYALDWRGTSRDDELAAAMESCAPFARGFPLTRYTMILEKALHPIPAEELQDDFFLSPTGRG